MGNKNTLVIHLTLIPYLTVVVYHELGHYVYAPFEFEGSIYNRLGFKHHITKNIFFITTLKSHAAKAESLELGLGIKLWI